MIVFPGGEAGDDRTVPFDIVDIGDPLTTPACAAIFVGGGQFAIAISAHGKDELLPLHQLFEAAGRHRRFAFLLRLRSEEHTSELQSLMRISYAVFFLKK